VISWSGYFLFLLLVGILSFEVLSRVILKTLVDNVMSEERNLTYQYDAQLGWRPAADSEKTLVGSQPFSFRHNRRGFRDREPRSIKTKPRILFLGDSFVWGYDVGQNERFTERLQNRLPHWEVINMGVSGYSTDQELILLQREYDFYQPDIIVLICCRNDRRDNAANSAYGYFKPYFIKQGGRLTIQGVPVPKSYLYSLKDNNWLKRAVFFRIILLARQRIEMSKVRTDDPSADLLKSMNDFVKGWGHRFAVGFIDQDSELMAFCERENIAFFDLSSVNASYRFPSQGTHWTEKGHQRVSEKVYEFLSQNGFLSLSSESGQIP
jgi:lysophospholipase L1-like esterase